MHKARTVWRHYFFQACASFALYQVDCPAADKRAARAGSAVISTLVLADVSLCERNCAQAACGRFCTPRRACLKDACAPCEAMAQQTGWATKMAAQHLAPGRCRGCSLCTRAVTTRQATKTPAQYAGTGKPQASPPAKRHAKPLRGPAA